MKRKVLLYLLLCHVFCFGQKIKDIDIEIYKDFTIETPYTITPMTYEKFNYKDSIKVKNRVSVKKIVDIMRNMKIHYFVKRAITEEYSPIDVRGKIRLRHHDNKCDIYYISPVSLYQDGILYAFPKKLKVLIDKLFKENSLQQPFMGEYN